MKKPRQARSSSDPKIPTKEIFTCHPHGGYFFAKRELLVKEFYDGYQAKVFVYKFSHIETVSKKTTISVKKL